MHRIFAIRKAQKAAIEAASGKTNEVSTIEDITIVQTDEKHPNWWRRAQKIYPEKIIVTPPEPQDVKNTKCCIIV